MNKTVKQQQLVADDVLSKLECLDQYCIVAGGAARDWYLGNLATDIDVFLHFPYLKYSKQRINLLKYLGFNIVSVSEDWQIHELYEGNKCVKHLYTTEYFNEKVQIMFMYQPTFSSVVDTFPISISKAWYKSEVIKTTKDFDNSIKHKIIWKTVDVYSETNKYLTKIKTKFSDYKYVNKEEAHKIIVEGNKDLLIKELKEEIRLLKLRINDLSVTGY